MSIRFWTDQNRKSQRAKELMYIFKRFNETVDYSFCSSPPLLSTNVVVLHARLTH